MSYCPSTHLFEVINEAYSAVISMVALSVCLLYTFFIGKCVKMAHIKYTINVKYKASAFSMHGRALIVSKTGF